MPPRPLRLAREGITLRVARMKTPVRLRLEAAGVEGAIGVERFHPTVRAAVAEAVPASPPDGGTPPGGTR